MKILVLGGDGFCGWPTSLYLSSRGHDIHIVDNLSRRKIDVDLEVQSLTPIKSITDRVDAWQSITGRRIHFKHLDVARDYLGLRGYLCDNGFDAVIHFAEQRSAPYSMKTVATKRYTVENNIIGTHNLLCALTDLKMDVHVVHLGTMGVYGYGTSGGFPIPEGYLKVNITQPDGTVLEREIMHPPDPGSVYHLTKTLDALLFFFYNKNDFIRITDLHQGIVWGTNTDETMCDEALINRFDYDGDYGTVLNRFLMQVACQYPLTVHGTGGQKRAFIHIRDSVRCIEIALDNPPSRGERVRIFNQMTETHRVIDLAKKISEMTGAPIQYLDNPRNEAEENELIVEHNGLLSYGLNPITLSEGLMLEVRDVALRYIDRVDKRRIPATSLWRA